MGHRGLWQLTAPCMTDSTVGWRLPGPFDRCAHCWAVTRFEKAVGSAQNARRSFIAPRLLEATQRVLMAIHEAIGSGRRSAPALHG